MGFGISVVGLGILGMIQTDAQLAELLPQLEPVDRIAVDTEADSLHCYYEKLCLVQLSIAGPR